MSNFKIVGILIIASFIEDYIFANYLIFFPHTRGVSIMAAGLISSVISNFLYVVIVRVAIQIILKKLEVAPARLRYEVIMIPVAIVFTVFPAMEVLEIYPGEICQNLQQTTVFGIFCRLATQVWPKLIFNIFAFAAAAFMAINVFRLFRFFYIKYKI